MSQPVAATWMSVELKALPLLRKYAVVCGLVLLLIAAAIWAPGFYTRSTLRNTTQQASLIGIVALGQFLVLMIRGIDLSIPAVVGFTAVLVADRGPGSTPGVLLSIAIALSVACLNSYLVIRRNVPPFVATFGMAVVLAGLQLTYTKGGASGSTDSAIVTIGQGAIFGVNYSTWVWLVLALLTSQFLYRTTYGRRMVMAGSNPQMAKLSGVRVGRYVLGAFVASALLALLCALFTAGSTGYVDRFMGLGTDLDSLTIALIAGSRFSGGEGSIVSVIAGSLLLASLLTLIVLLGWNAELQLIAKGVVLISAIALQSLARNRAA